MKIVGKMNHEKSFESLTSWGCKCGARWRNDELKGKTDGDLEYERDAAFDRHIKEMLERGF